MKRVFYPFWVVALTASVWAGCAKKDSGGGEGGGGGGGSASIAQAMSRCTTVASQMLIHPGQACAMVRAGNTRCPSLVDYISSPELQQMSGQINNPAFEQAYYELEACDSYDLGVCARALTTFSQGWQRIVNTAFCTREDAVWIRQQLDDVTRSIQRREYNPNAGFNQGGFNQFGPRGW